MRKIKTVKINNVYAMIRNLDLFSRILIGQYDEIVQAMNMGKVFSDYEAPELANALCQLRGKLIPELKNRNLATYLGIWNPDTPQIAMRAYDLQQCLRYQLAYHSNPKGYITVNYDAPIIYGNWNISENQIKEYHRILAEQKCPDYQPDFLIRYPWSCPIILDHFHDELHLVDLIVDDSLAQNIIKEAEEWHRYINYSDLFPVFKATGQYHCVDMEDEELKDVSKKIEILIRNYIENCW